MAITGLVGERAQHRELLLRKLAASERATVIAPIGFAPRISGTESTLRYPAALAVAPDA
jgi:hypothetical protein